jgi:hypothetical protein
MRKRLREITDLPLRMRIVFFREQAYVVAKAGPRPGQQLAAALNRNRHAND